MMNCLSYLLLIVTTINGVVRGDVIPSNSSRTSRVIVQIPSDLHKKHGELHEQSLFGFSKESWGEPFGTIAAFVYYVETPDDLCSPADFDKNTTKVYPAVTDGLKSPFVLLTLTHGNEMDNCSPVEKVRNAQFHGAAAAIIAQDHCRCDDTDCIKVYGAQNCGKQDMTKYMINDGTADDISIPSFLIYKTSGHDIISKLKESQPVLIELTWGMKDWGDEYDEHPTVRYHLWTTAFDNNVHDLETYKHYRIISNALADHGAMFEPRYALIDGKRFHCDQEAFNVYCDHLCSNGGRYCALHVTDLSGKAIVAETLNRICIFELFGSKTFWDYTVYHREHCGEPHKFADKDCLEKAYRETKIDQGRLESCVKDSGGVDENMVNAKLEEQLVKMAHSGIVTTPALTVNHHIIQEPSSFGMFEHLCRHFFTNNLTTTPDICFTCATCPNIIGCVEEGKCVEFEKPEPARQHKKKSGRGWIIFWVMFIMVATGGGLYIYKKRQEGGGSFNGGSLNSYFQLSGEER